MKSFQIFSGFLVCILAVGCHEQASTVRNSSNPLDPPIAQSHQSDRTQVNPVAASSEKKIDVTQTADTSADASEGKVALPPAMGIQVVKDINWNERTQMLHPGTIRSEVEALLPPMSPEPGKPFEPVLELPRNGASTLVYPLDATTQAQIDYLVDAQGQYTLSTVRLTKAKTPQKNSP